jgi:hypothetical protein
MELKLIALKIKRRYTMKKVLTLLLLIAPVLYSSAQIWRTKQSGSWNDISTWEYFTGGTTWSPAVAVPNANISVWIQDGDSVYFTNNGSCKDLHLNSDIDANDSARLNTGSYVLSVNGKLRTYTGAKNGLIPGANSTGLNNSRRFVLGTIRLAGPSRNATLAGEWGVPLNFTNWTLDVSLNSNTDIVTFKTNFRAGNITISNGGLLMDPATGGALRPDGGGSGTGTLTVKQNGTLIMNSTTVARTAATAFGSFTLESGGTLILPAGTTNSGIAATTVSMLGTVISRNGRLPNPAAVPGGAGIFTFTNLTLEANLNAATNFTVNGTLHLDSCKLICAPTRKLTMGPSGNITLYDPSAFVEGPMSHTINTTSPVVKFFPLGYGTEYRPMQLHITQDAVTSTLYTGELIISSGFTHASNPTIDSFYTKKEWWVAKGSGANIVREDVSLSYGPGDGISDISRLRVARMTGSGLNWENLGGSANAGMVTSDVNITSGDRFILVRGIPVRAMGADLSYTTAGQDSILVTLKVYRECSDYGPGNYVVMKASTSGPAGTETIAWMLPRKSIADITSLCAGTASKCAGGSSGYGVEEITYEGIVDISSFTSSSCDITISYTANMRSAGLTNLSPDQPLHTFVYFDRCKAAGNASPVHSNAPPLLCSAGNAFYAQQWKHRSRR